MEKIALPGTSLVFISFLFSSFVHAQDESNNISISSAYEEYEFMKGKNENPVIIREKLDTKFKCNGFRTSIPFAQFYDNKSSIDEINIYVNGSRAKKIVPVCDFYTINDIFYSDARVCYFDLPFEKRGTESEVAVEKTVTDPRYFSTIYFDEPYLVEHKEVTIKIPDWMKVAIKEYNFPENGIVKTVQQGDHAIVYTYSISNLPSRKKTGNSPGPSFLYPHLLILEQSAAPEGSPEIVYFKTLREQYNWYHSLVGQIGNDDSPFRDKVAEITRDKKTDVEKIGAVYNWVQANIRYVAFEDGIAGFMPEKAQEVFRKKYGDCKGMANLTKEMLRTIGFDARLCWLGTNHIAYDYSTPSLAVDNHMICAVKIEGRLIYLDATEKYIGFGEYAERIQGRQILIENGDQYLLETVPVQPSTQNTEAINQELKIVGGNILGSVKLTYKGESKEDLLFQINNISSQERQSSLEQFLSGNNNNYKIKNLKTSVLQDWNGDLSVQYDLEYDNAVTEFGSEKYLDMDLGKEFANLKIDTSRKQDYWMPFKFHISNTTEMILPEGFVPEQLPSRLIIKNDSWMFDLEYSLTGNKLTYKKEIKIFNTLIKVRQFAQWNNDIAKLTNFYNEQITLKNQK
jgi:hypothetical protein